MAGIRLVAQLRVADGTSQQLIAGWRDHLRDVAAEPGCLQYEMFQSVDDPEQIALLEHWSSREAFDSHWERELAQPGGPGVAEVNELVIESAGALYHTEIYDRRRHDYIDGSWIGSE